MKNTKLLLAAGLLAVLCAAVLFFHFHGRHKTSPATYPVQHGGQCDDPAFYNSHMSGCAVQ